MTQFGNLAQPDLAQYIVSGSDLDAWRQAAHQQAISADIDPQEIDWLLRAMSNLDGLSLKLGTFRSKAAIPLTLSLAELDQCWQQRLRQQVPVQYLVGETPWRHFSLVVSPAVLIPRPETELVIDLALDAVAESQQGEQLRQGVWVDLGTGSGAIALGLAHAFPQARILAVDHSSAALVVAKTNAERYGFSDRITFYQGSWFQPLTSFRQQLSAVISNPPYIPTSVLPTLQPEVIQHEPLDALNGGTDGLEAIRTLVAQAPDYLVTGGLWLVEMMAGQGQAVQALLEQQGQYQEIQICKDLAGHDRFALAFRR